MGQKIRVIRVPTTPRRVRPERSAALCEARTTSPRSLADGLLLRLHAECVGAGLAPAPCGGPSGIRTHDLLNAIETRSQLRYRPSSACGPGGIRTPDLLSAIEARSQLRYRPNKATEIVPDSMQSVKEGPACPCRPASNKTDVSRSRRGNNQKRSWVWPAGSQSGFG